MSTAARYTHGHHESVLRSHKWRTAQNSASYLLPHLRRGISLLDIGSGPGTLTADLAALVAPGRVSGLDQTEDVLDIARGEVAQRGLSNVDFVAGDAQQLNLPDAAFDVVHAHQVLQHLAAPVQALREMRRVCAPGGVVAARDSDYGGFVWFPQLPELDEWRQLYCAIARSNGGEPDAGRQLLGWARQAGFSRIDASSSTWCFATSEDRAWWGGMWADRIRESALARQAVDTGVATRADLERIARGWQRWVAADDGWLSVLHGEIIAWR